MTRHLTWAVAAVLVVALLGLALQSWLFPSAAQEDERPPTLATAAHSSVPAPTAHVAELNGEVEQYVEATGRWESLKKDAALSEDAVLRTKAGTTQLTIGDNVRIVVNPRSQFRLGEVSATLSKVKIEGGRVTASIEGGGERQLYVEVLGNDAVLKTADGEFSVIRSEQAQVTVATKRGSVDLSAKGHSVTVGEGEQATVEPGEQPGPVVKIPGSLFVKLSKSQQRKLSRRMTTISGETTPGAIVFINGVEVATKDGEFRAEVPLHEGANTVKVDAEDVLGRRQREELRGITVDTRPPKVKSMVEW